VRSVADELRREDEQAIAALTVAERVQLALRLGEESLAIYMAAQGVDGDTALRDLRKRNQIGRRRSRCLQEDAAA
jgi:hypothetical protein